MITQTAMTMRISSNCEEETMHLVDTKPGEEKALCGTDVPVHLQTGLQGYLTRRMDDLTVGNVCEGASLPRWVGLGATT